MTAYTRGYRPDYSDGTFRAEGPTGLDLHPEPLPFPTPPPPVSAHTMELYASLPDFVRAGDLAQQTGTNNYPLLRYLSIIGDEMQARRDLIERLDWVAPVDGGAPGDTSDLVNPLTADAAWLPWLGPLYGISRADVEAMTTAQTRAAIENVIVNGFGGVKPGDIVAAARGALTGSRYVVVRDHYGPAGPYAATDPAGEFNLTVVTRATETPSAAAVLAAIDARDAAPAGVKVHHRLATSTVAEIEANVGGTAGDWAGKVSRIMEAGLA